jgi:hypothetical protein
MPRVTVVRTVGVRAATTQLVAFADEDSWWAPGSSHEAAAVLAGHPRRSLAARSRLREDPRMRRLLAQW